MRAYERFLNYVKIDTQSDHFSDACPSTEKQHDLQIVLERELAELGLSGIRRTETGYLYATLPATKGFENSEAVGLIAHVDTSPDISGANVNPRIIESYDGGPLVLDRDGKYVLSPDRFPSLLKYIGQSLIVTDGTTLLGADDKAGVAEIITALERIIEQSIPHRELRICFTPDEEVGRGVDGFDADYFGAKHAYTVDGGSLDCYSIETFNAASAAVTVTGENIHPGSAKNKMKNSILYAMEFNSMLPEMERPDCTEGYEGFYHLDNISGDVEKCVMRYIIRDHDAAKLADKKEKMQTVASLLNGKYGEGTVELVIKDSYRNMREVLDGCPQVVERLVNAMKRAGIENPVALPVRGGTDGARLSFMGIPCPNMPTGGQNGHGRYEYISVEAMDKVVDIILGITAP